MINYLISLATISYLIIERQRITITTHTIQSSKLKHNKTIVQLSDLHGHVFYKNNNRLLAKLKQLNPDIICLTGDLINANKNSGERVITFIRALNFKKPIFYISGNHELAIKTRHDWVEDYEQQLKQLGVIILENTAESYDDLTIYGLVTPLDDIQNTPFTTHPTPNDLIRKKQNAKVDDFSICLSHSPFIDSTIKDAAFDVIISGHVHGGIIRIPFVGGLLSPDRTFFPKYDAGTYQINNTLLVVNRGLGHSKVIPFRVNNPPEITVLQLKTSKTMTVIEW